MKTILLLAATICMFARSQTSIAADVPPVRAIYQRPEGFPGLIVGLKFEEVRTGKIIVYHPKDKEGAAEGGSLFYKPVFSPSGVWMFLPVGQFDGYIFFPARQWREGLVNRTIGTRFYVSSPDGPALFHRFVKWVGRDEVRVTVGTGLDVFPIDINLRTCKAKFVNKKLFGDWLHFTEVRGDTMQTGKTKAKNGK